MATVPRLHTYPLSRLHFRPELHRSYYLDPTSVSLLAGSKHYNRPRRRELSRRWCVSFKEDREDVELGVEKKETGVSQGNPVIRSLKSAILGISNWPSYSKEKRKSTLDELEELFSSIALQIGRYIVTMMSTGVVLAVGFQISGGDEQMNSLIWYSWLGGVIIGTMVGANMVLDEYSRAGPRNVVITGSTRGLGKALAREFLLSGDRVIVTSRSADSVDETVKELQQNLTELVTDDSKNLNHAKVVGIACDVCQLASSALLGWCVPFFSQLSSSLVSQLYKKPIENEWFKVH